MSFQWLSWLPISTITGDNFSIVTPIDLYQISKENGKYLFFSFIPYISYQWENLIYSLDSRGGWELSGIRGMSLKETGYGENSLAKLPRLRPPQPHCTLMVWKIRLGLYRCGNGQELLFRQLLMCMNVKHHTKIKIAVKISFHIFNSKTL